MSCNKKDARYYYDETQKLLDKYKTNDGQVDWWPVCRDLFTIENPVMQEHNLKSECADYSGRKTENSAWTFSLYIIAWTLYNFKMKTLDGHCRSIAHGHGTAEPKCKKGSEFHNELYIECFNSFKNILDEFEKDPPNLIV
jgi:hypothetical protein